jgi:hypothetical protein
MDFIRTMDHKSAAKLALNWPRNASFWQYLKMNPTIAGMGFWKRMKHANVCHKAQQAADYAKIVR